MSGLVHISKMLDEWADQFDAVRGERMKIKITQDGQPCRKCGTPVVKKSHDAPMSPEQDYWFPTWFDCPKCGTRYMGPREQVRQVKMCGNCGELPQKDDSNFCNRCADEFI
jgi:hypothetical protein